MIPQVIGLLIRYLILKKIYSNRAVENPNVTVTHILQHSHTVILKLGLYKNIVIFRVVILFP